MELSPGWEGRAGTRLPLRGVGPQVGVGEDSALSGLCHGCLGYRVRPASLQLPVPAPRAVFCAIRRERLFSDKKAREKL